MQGDEIPLSGELLNSQLSELTSDQMLQIYRAGAAFGLRLTKFKRTMGLARVAKVLGTLKSILPASLLDVGSGRGAFLWPLLDQFPQLTVTAIDQHPQRAHDLQAVHLGGVRRLTADHFDVTKLPYDDDQFDVVTVLEVLEHIPNYATAIAEACRVAGRFVIASVPSKPDDNPEHIHLLTRHKLSAAFEQAGAETVTFDAVLNHLILVARVG